MYDEYKEILAMSASICTILQILTGVLICQQFIKKGSTGDLSSFPFVSGFLSNSMWLHYGFLVSDQSLILVNTAGSTLYLAYSITFYLYCLKKSIVIQQVASSTLVILITVIYTRMEPDAAIATSRVGILCCLLTMMFFASPLAMLAHVIRVKSAESLPFSLILAGFVVSVLWFLYGVVLEDPFVQFPNAMGALLAGSQLTLFLIYPAKTNVGKLTVR